MAIFISFIFKSLIASGFLYGYYYLALRNKNFHAYNRFYLLSSLIISLVIPFINFNGFHTDVVPNIPLINLVNISSATENHSSPFFNTGFLISYISILISTVLLILLSIRIMWIYSIKKKNKNTKMQGFTLIETGVKQAPFSFFSNLFWKQGLSSTDTNGEKIFKHELTHIRQKHTYDKLFTQIVCCLFWINPFYWLILRELTNIHEFIADKSCIEHGDTESLATMLLYSYSEGSYLLPSHSFFNTSLNRRLLMVGSSTKIRYSYVRKILALPVVVLVVVISSVCVTTTKNTELNGQMVKNAQKPAGNIVLQSASTPSKPNPKLKVVTGYQLKEIPPQKAKLRPATQGMEPIPVTGYQLNN